MDAEVYIWLHGAILAPGTIGSRHLFPETIHFTAYKIIPQSCLAN